MTFFILLLSSMFFVRTYQSNICSAPVDHYCPWIDKFTFFLKCRKGTYQDQRGQTSCKRCKDGEYNIQTGQSKCNICPVGHHCLWKSKSPLKCGKGFYQDQRGKKLCIVCPSGSFCPSTGPVVPGNKIMLAIRNAVKYAAEAYEDVEPADSRLVDEKNNIQGFVKYEGNTIVVSFRGTDDINDWKSNINIKKRDYQGCKSCKTHTGFSIIYYSVQKQMFSKVKALSHVHSSSTVLVTGQSLGGALATLAAVDLAKAGYQVDLITYGSPRVGNKEFSEYVDEALNGLNLRVTCKNDYVSVLPPKALGYWHVGQEIHCVGRKSCYEFPPNKDFTHVRISINDHRMINYLAI